MIVWGGEDSGYLDTGGRYDPATDTWTATATDNAPSARSFHTAVWTGSEMIVWGARAAAARRLYEPETPFESSPLMLWSNKIRGTTWLGS